MVAVNIEPGYPLDEWMDFWEEVGDGLVLLAQDTTGTTVRAYKLFALGTEVIVGREGSVVFRSDGPAGYKKLQSEIEDAL